MKHSVDVDLSPQDALSCYLRDCEGNYLIDAQMNLVKTELLQRDVYLLAQVMVELWMNAQLLVKMVQNIKNTFLKIFMRL